jgi:putative hemolysin
MARKEIRFPELSYASSSQPRLARWFIRSVEGLSGRDRYARLYEIWRREVTSGADRIFGRLLELIDLSVRSPDPWPPAIDPQTPLVIIANHPFGIGDGVAVLARAEQLCRPFRVMIHSDLLKIREMEPYALPVDFSETREAVKNNLAVRHQALNLLKQGKCSSPAWCRTRRRPSFRFISPDKTAVSSISSAGRCTLPRATRNLPISWAGFL